MITFYTQEDLVHFGTYLLSEKRISSIENKDNLNKVHQEDIDNWINLDAQTIEYQSEYLKRATEYFRKEFEKKDINLFKDFLNK